MKLGIIGAGKVGFSLGKYLKNHYYDLMGYYSRSYKSSLEAKEFTDTECYESLYDILKVCDILFLCVNDDSIKDVVNELKKYDVKNKIIVHLSGVHKSSIIDLDCFKYSIHPILAINDKYTSYKKLDDCFYTIEGDNKYIDYFLKMFKNIKVIDSSNKEKYHAICSILSNLVNSLVYLCDKELNKIDLDINCFLNLFYNNALNIYELGYYNSLTGPHKRGDLETINKHLKALDGNILEVYKILSLELGMLLDNKNIINLVGEKNDNC